MSRQRKRACLEHGKKLDLAYLIREDYAHPGQMCGPNALRWFSSISGETTSVGYISADLRRESDGQFRIELGDLDQRVAMVSSKRHFGGYQWYFKCPVTNENVSVLWKPPGAPLFAGRKAWWGAVAYQSQFGSWIDRAHAGKAKLKAQLLGDCDPEEWDLPPKPVGMWWSTYDRLVARFDRYQSKLDAGLASLRYLDDRETPTDFD
jgi:hypothetical protein